VSEPEIDGQRPEVESSDATVEGTDAGAADDAGSGAGAGEGAGEPVLAVEGVARSFGDVEVFADVSLSVRPGEIVAVIGPNGSGKSTLLRIAAGLLDPSAGEVTRPSDGSGRSVAFLPQQPAFRPGFTVAETLRFYVDLLGGGDGETGDPDATDPDEVVADALASVGLSDAADRRVEALSGGMTRLLGLASATLGDPELVVLDEPTSDLDPALTERTLAAVVDAADDGRAILFASHDLPGVEEVADAVVLLDGGTVRATGSPAELRERAGADTLRHAFAALVDDDAVARVGRRSGEGATGHDGRTRGRSDGDDRTGATADGGEDATAGSEDATTGSEDATTGSEDATTGSEDDRAATGPEDDRPAASPEGAGDGEGGASS